MNEEEDAFGLLGSGTSADSNADSGSSGTNASDTGFWEGAGTFLKGFVNSAGKFWNTQQNYNYNLQNQTLTTNAVTNVVKYVAVVVAAVVAVYVLVKTVFK